MTHRPEDVQATFCATLVDQWCRMGLRHAVIAPGSRSTPMALALAQRDDLRVHVVHDERSAAFVALGVGLATRVPAALLCTSGTAATHFHAAVVEADLSGVPMLVLTADRPPELQGIGAPQTIDQIDLYGGVVRCFADTGVADASDAAMWRDCASDWWLSAVDGDPGPVHLNLPFREPLIGAVSDLPVATLLPESEPDGWFMMRPDIAALAEMIDQPRGVIVAGAGTDDAAAVEALASALGWPVLADPRSGCRGLSQAVCAFDSLLRHPPFASQHVPSVVLHFGEPPASKVLGQWLQATGAAHIQVHAQQRVVDPLGIISERVYGWPSTLCNELVAVLPGTTDRAWLTEWQKAEANAQQAIDDVLTRPDALTEPGVARVLSRLDAQLVVASSMPIRDIEWFGNGTANVHANRGANGIDGVIATSIGVAAGTGGPTVAFLGDVAFCHDQSSLTALPSRHLDLKIVVTDNDGGAIFSFLPQATELPPGRFEQLFGTPHGTDLVAVARAHGLGACTATTVDELTKALDDPAVQVIRVATDRPENVMLHAQLHAAVAAVL